MLLANSFLGDIAQIKMYANENRQTKISIGDNPLFISTLVDTKVVPQTKIIKKANMW